MSSVMLTSARPGKAATRVPRKRKVLVAGRVGRTQSALRTVLGRCNVSMRCYTTPRECLVGLERRPCDLLVVCLDDDPDGGFELVKQAKSLYPSTPILAFVKPGGVPLAVGVMKAGATDCLETSVKTTALRSTVLGLLEQYCAEERNADPGLTQTESLVLAHILKGRTSREVADQLHRSPRTIEVHRQAIMHKLGASSKVDLVKRAASLGLMAPRDPRSTTGCVQSPGP